MRLFLGVSGFEAEAAANSVSLALILRYVAALTATAPRAYALSTIAYFPITITNNQSTATEYYVQNITLGWKAAQPPAAPAPHPPSPGSN
jgi:hypothetical protein